MYQVSNHGRVRSLDRIVVRPLRGDMKLKGRKLKQISNRGCRQVSLSKDGDGKNHKVHVLVASAFLGPRPEGKETCHGPNGKLDNSVSNLSYGTHGDNMRDRERDKVGLSKPVRRSDGLEYQSITEAAKAEGIKLANISAVCCKYIKPNGGKCLTAGGYGWEFI